MTQLTKWVNEVELMKKAKKKVSFCQKQYKYTIISKIGEIISIKIRILHNDFHETYNDQISRNYEIGEKAKKKVSFCCKSAKK